MVNTLYIVKQNPQPLCPPPPKGRSAWLRVIVCVVVFHRPFSQPSPPSLIPDVTSAARDGSLFLRSDIDWGSRNEAARAWSYTARLCLSFLTVPLEETDGARKTRETTTGRNFTSDVFIRPTAPRAANGGNGFHLQKRIALVSTFWQQPAACQFISRALTCLLPSLSLSLFVLFFSSRFFCGSGLTHRLLWVSLSRSSFMANCETRPGDGEERVDERGWINSGGD